MSAPLIEGPFWYRTRIRRLGPAAALIPPAILGVIAIGALKVFDGAWSGAVGLIAGVRCSRLWWSIFVGANRAVRWRSRIGRDGALVGVLAIASGTRNPMATWSDYWRQYFGCAVASGWVLRRPPRVGEVVGQHSSDRRRPHARRHQSRSASNLSARCGHPVRSST
jgi:hypothetical protein